MRIYSLSFGSADSLFGILWYFDYTLCTLAAYLYYPTYLVHSCIVSPRNSCGRHWPFILTESDLQL